MRGVLVLGLAVALAGVAFAYLLGLLVEREQAESIARDFTRRLELEDRFRAAAGDDPEGGIGGDPQP